jgi:AraC family transcriptional regulator
MWVRTKFARSVKLLLAGRRMTSRMRQQTVDTHRDAVLRAARLIASSLDHALDLQTLASRVAVSPQHFHRIFRRELGETPLVLHRRLRLERAALELANSTVAVTMIAFDAGYDTHETFTRAFQAAYSQAPSEFRKRMQAHRERMGQPRLVPFQLPTPNGIHVDISKIVAGTEQSIGDNQMTAEIITAPTLHLAAITHMGPRNTIGEAFGTLAGIAGPAGLFGAPGAQGVAVFHGEPEGTPAALIRTDAGITVGDGIKIPEGLSKLTVPGGIYAKATHYGHYATLADSWHKLCAEVAGGAQAKIREGDISYEVYRVADHSRPDELETDLYLPVERL